jgi:hypothetical protein
MESLERLVAGLTQSQFDYLNRNRGFARELLDEYDLRNRAERGDPRARAQIAEIDRARVMETSRAAAMPAWPSTRPANGSRPAAWRGAQAWADVEPDPMGISMPAPAPNGGPIFALRENGSDRPAVVMPAPGRSITSLYPRVAPRPKGKEMTPLMAGTLSAGAAASIADGPAPFGEAAALAAILGVAAYEMWSESTGDSPEAPASGNHDSDSHENDASTEEQETREEREEKCHREQMREMKECSKIWRQNLKLQEQGREDLAKRKRMLWGRCKESSEARHTECLNYGAPRRDLDLGQSDED